MREWIEQHPYLTGALVLVLIVLFFVFRRSSSAGGTTTQSSAGTAGPSESLQAAGLAAGVQLQTSRDQLNYGIAGLNAQVSTTALLSAADVKKTEIAAGVSLQDILSGQEVTDTLTAAQLQLGLAQVGQTVLPSAPQSIPVIVVPQSQGAASAANFGNSFISSAPTFKDPSPGTVFDYAHWISGVPGPIPGDFNPADAAAHVALIDTANAAYISDPCSPHNVDYGNPASIPAACSGR